jgi:hypothetical protein
MIWVSSTSSVPKIAYAAVTCLFLSMAAMVVSGCTAIDLQSPPPDVKAFFVAGNKANFLGLQSLSADCVDLSAYDRQMGVKYPPTLQVDILNTPPSRPYKVFAVLECESSVQSGSERLMEGLKNKARQIGADALVLCHAGTDQGLPGVSPTQKMQAVAIKYILTGGAKRENNL